MKTTHLNLHIKFVHDGTPEDESRIARRLNDLIAIAATQQLKNGEKVDIEIATGDISAFGFSNQIRPMYGNAVTNPAYSPEQP